MENIHSIGYVDEEYMAMIHTEVKHEDMKRIPKAKEAVDNEWKKLIDMGAFGMKAFEAMDKVKARYEKNKQPVHFGNLRAIYHEKHSELPKADRKYKGRVVFRGDTVKDIDGYYAVFSEQGTSSSHMAATKFIDAIARMPGMDGEDSDAMSAHTQVELKNVSKFLGKGCQFIDAWVTLPRYLVPDEFQHLEFPVCPLCRNLYGHKLAGLLWQKFAEDIIINKLKFECVQEWECLYYHPVENFFCQSMLMISRWQAKNKTWLRCGS